MVTWKGFRKSGYHVERGKEQKLLVKRVTREEEHLRSAEGLRGSERDLCKSLVHE